MRNLRLPLDQVKQFKSERILASYGRNLGIQKDVFLENGLSLIFHRNHTPKEIKSGKSVLVLQHEEVLLISSGKDQALNDVFIISFSKLALDEAIKENKLTKKDIAYLDQDFFTKLIPTIWLKSLLKQFFYETIMMIDSTPGCTFFLEKQIINEIMRNLFTNYHSKDDKIDVILDPQMNEIIKLIEYSLHDETLSVERIAKESGMSESSLLRKFKSCFGVTPYSYIKDRRLENAYNLIKVNKLNVSEACMTVGYSDFASFSKSFKSKFGILPSRILR